MNPMKPAIQPPSAMSVIPTTTSTKTQRKKPVSKLPSNRIAFFSIISYLLPVPVYLAWHFPLGCCVAKESRAAPLKATRPILYLLATRLSRWDPWLSVTALQQLWLCHVLSDLVYTIPEFFDDVKFQDLSIMKACEHPAEDLAQQPRGGRLHWLVLAPYVESSTNGASFLVFPSVNKIVIPPWPCKKLHYFTWRFLGCSCIFPAEKLATASWKLHP